MLSNKHKSLDSPYKPGTGLFVHICNTAFGKRVKNEEIEGRFRAGALIDTANISRALAFVNMDFMTYENKKASEIVQIMEYVKNMVCENINKYHSLMVLISTHGVKDKIFGVDEECVDVEELIIKPFHNYRCLGLRGKPKIFIFNCCRGTLDAMPMVVMREAAKDSASYYGDAHTDGDGFVIKSIQPMDTISMVGDYLVLYSTPKDFVSFRFPERGSPLIQTLASTIMELSGNQELHHVEFLSLAKMVQKRVIKEFDLVIGFEDYLMKPFFLPIRGE